jgi:methionyl-tRNA formyltransferase
MSNTNNKISLVIITSTSRRHRFFANSFLDDFDVRGIIREEKKPALQLANIQDEILKRHFSEREEKEKFYFEKSPELPENKVWYLANGQTNNDETLKYIKEKNPDFVVLFGSSIIKEPILSFFENRIINMHLGLSPYYRGSGTNFWPLVFGEPEAVGVTIHLATLKVDAGNILGQTRPDPAIDDRCHDLGCKTIMAGVNLFKKILTALNDNLIKPSSQDLTQGKVFQNKDTTPEAVLKMWKNFDNGLMAEYINKKGERDAKFPIINFN